MKTKTKGSGRRCLGDTKEDEDTLMKDVRKEEGV